ncbi:MAG: 4-hydroxy-tetrahydrodipicolinate synthase [Spirochaetaceae bacterium]|jgi:4-hydroxy-tetrahydrodipicolinate synthase|nr:4-hydroxy-tetrahydrodipicolinate synthase [Spirochaetaceae bacterium]GMO23589.1 MAG: 4-hydroxy-tetrahydrodipicolinate synthase [Termitinemataceae bacterium]
MKGGVWTALITPMKDSGEVDFEGWRKLIRMQIEAGIDGLVPIGTTGETPTLDEAEEEELIKIAIAESKANDGKKAVPVLVGAGSNSTKHAVLYCERAKTLGADAALVVTPYYNKPNDSGLLRHFEAVAATGIPIIVYNIAGRTGRNIPTPLMAKIAEIPGIAGIKEASGDINQMGEVLRVIRAKKHEAGAEFTVFSGDDGLTLPLMALGGDGIISVISNLVPKKVLALVNAALAGDFNSARKIHFELLPFIYAAFIETNPVPIKYAMRLAGLPAGPCRMPLGELSGASKEIVERETRALLKTLRA